MRVYDTALFTHRGRVRGKNEDAVLAHGRVFQDDLRGVISVRLSGTPQALIVADGIGGQPRGERASRSAIHFLSSDDRLVQGVSGCEAALHAANERLYELMDEPECAGMGTTIAGFVLQERAVVSFNVGDSRAYRFGRGRLVRLSQDDVVTDRGAVRDRSREITQCLGGAQFPLAIAPHVTVGPPLETGQCLILCTDGLTEVLDDTELESIVRNSASSVTMVEKLVRRAISQGSRDNISVLVSIAAEPSTDAAGRKP